MGFPWEYLPFRHRGNVFICHDLLSIAHLEAFHRAILIGFDTWNMVKNCRTADGGCVQPHGCCLKVESKPYLGTLFGDPLKIWGVPSKFSNWIRIEKSGEGSNHQRLIPRTSGNSWSVHVQTVPWYPVEFQNCSFSLDWSKQKLFSVPRPNCWCHLFLSLSPSRQVNVIPTSSWPSVFLLNMNSSDRQYNLNEVGLPHGFWNTWVCTRVGCSENPVIYLSSFPH